MQTWRHARAADLIGQVVVQTAQPKISAQIDWRLDVIGTDYGALSEVSPLISYQGDINHGISALVGCGITRRA
jgi:hypothetical protein